MPPKNEKMKRNTIAAIPKSSCSAYRQVACQRQKIARRFRPIPAGRSDHTDLALAQDMAIAHIRPMIGRSTPDDILPTYDRVATDFQAQRGRSLFEKSRLDRLLGVAPRNVSPRRLLDLGCGTGAPIATYLAERGVSVTGVDGAAAMIELFRQTLPNATAHHADMRGLDLGSKFDAILAWNSFFHLSPDDQRAMFPVFAKHAAPKAALMFTAGPSAGEVWGTAGGESVYHSSLDPQEYRDLLAANGFKVLEYRPEDPTCNNHTIWLARFTQN